jgi:hypothetical protein
MIHHPRAPAQAFSCNLVYTTGGSLLDSRPGSLLPSAEESSRSRDAVCKIHPFVGHGMRCVVEREPDFTQRAYEIEIGNIRHVVLVFLLLT